MHLNKRTPILSLNLNGLLLDTYLLIPFPVWKGAIRELNFFSVKSQLRQFFSAYLIEARMLSRQIILL